LLLRDLEQATQRIWGPPCDGSDAPPPGVARWRQVLASVRHDVERGRVRSVSGLSRAARRLELEMAPVAGADRL
jgi:hypothetical protein